MNNSSAIDTYQYGENNDSYSKGSIERKLKTEFNEKIFQHSNDIKQRFIELINKEIENRILIFKKYEKMSYVNFYEDFEEEVIYAMENAITDYFLYHNK